MKQKIAISLLLGSSQAIKLSEKEEPQEISSLASLAGHGGLFSAYLDNLKDGEVKPSLD